MLKQAQSVMLSNWDALADCLTDLDEDEVDRQIMIIDQLIANPQ